MRLSESEGSPIALILIMALFASLESDALAQTCEARFMSATCFALSVVSAGQTKSSFAIRYLYS